MSDVLQIRPDEGDPARPSGVPAEAPHEAAPEHPDAEKAVRQPLYPRLLGLQHVHPNAWQRAALGEGMAVVGGLLAMADLASAWSILVLPAAVAVVVKGHDVLAGALSHDTG